MGGGLEERNQYNRNYDTSLNNCKSPTSLKEAGKTAATSSVANNNYGSELNYYIVTDTEEYYYRSVEPY